MFVTCATSHALSGWLKMAAYSNVACVAPRHAHAAWPSLEPSYEYGCPTSPLPLRALTYWRRLVPAY